MVTDQSQAVVWQTEQTPFGEVTETTGTLAQPLRFPGQYTDPETGYSYNYFRDYDPSIGRYVQSDPIGLRGGINTYGYVEQNPLIKIDPFGLDSLICRGNRRECLTQTGGRGNIMLPGLPALPLCPTNGGMYSDSEGSGSDNNSTASGSRGRPWAGEPGSTVGPNQGGDSRRYGNDGYPEVDYDAPHPNEGYPGNVDHAHNWDRPSDGGPPTNKNRGPGAPYSPL